MVNKILANLNFLIHTLIIYSKIKISSGKGICIGGSAGTNNVASLNKAEYLIYNKPNALVECWNPSSVSTVTCTSSTWTCKVWLTL